MLNIDNMIFIHGRLTRDVELATSPAGNDYCRFSVAVDRQGRDAEKPVFFNCIAFGKSAQAIARYFYKGKPIRIAGTMENDPYTAKDGTTRDSWTVKVDLWGFDQADPKGHATRPETAPAAAKEPAPDLSAFGDTYDAQADDIPF